MMSKHAHTWELQNHRVSSHEHRTMWRGKPADVHMYSLTFTCTECKALTTVAAPFDMGQGKQW